jgi:hypothetical protein
MVRTNRFVLIQTEGVLSLQTVLTSLGIPIIAADSQAVDNFKGYVLAVDISEESQIPGRDEFIASTRVMIPASSLGTFCSDLADFALHNENLVKWKLTLNLGLNLGRPSNFNPLANFYTEKVQRELLRPFVTFMRGLNSVQILGDIDQELGKSVRQNLLQSPTWDAEKVLRDLEAAKEQGLQIFCEEQHREALNIWWQATSRIESLQTRRDGTWNMLVQHGGRPFLDRVAQAYFLTKLSVARAGLLLLRLDSDTTMPLCIEYALHQATMSSQPGHWTKGYEWRPSSREMAIMHHMHAMFFRLEGQPENVYNALYAINAALEIEPHDLAMIKEKDDIITWIESVDPRE